MVEPGAVAAAGLWPALPVTGAYLLSRFGRVLAPCSTPAPTTFALACVAGMLAWSPLLLGFAAAGRFSPQLFGILGWAITLAAIGRLWRRPARPTLPRLSPWDWALAAGLAVAAGLYLAFPGESVLAGRDENSYSLLGIWITRTGGLDIAYPWPAVAQPVLFDAFIRVPGTFKTLPTMTPAFGHLFPVWLAEAYASFGFGGLLRLNAILALLAAAVFHGVCRAIMPTPYAVGATLLFALNPSQIWASRITLTEVFTQLTIWSGLLLLLRALRAGSRAQAGWFGLTLGLAVLIRIDSLILLPLLFLAHAALLVVDDAPRQSSRPWGATYATAIPSVALACCYYGLFSRPYVRELVPQLLQIVALAAVCQVVLIATAKTRLKQVLHPLAHSTWLSTALAVLLPALATYAYWLRPRSEPFERYGDFQLHLAGERTYAEDSLVNLAAYLSPAVVWAAVLGVILLARMAIREGTLRPFLTVLLIWGGYAAIYLHRPSITPAHIWAIRRFVPIVIPGFVLFAGFGGWRLGERLRSGRVRRLFGVAVWTFLAIFCLRASAFQVVRSEHNGYLSELRTLAQRLPQDEVILAIGREQWWKPLYMAFGRRVVAIDPATVEGERAFGDWVDAQVRGGHPVTLLATEPPRLRGLQVRRVSEVALHREGIRATPKPLPADWVMSEQRVGVYTVTGVARGFRPLNVDLVRGLVWGVRRSGFYQGQKLNGIPVSWTDGHGRIEVALPESTEPTRLAVELRPTVRGGSALRILANGRELYDGKVRPGETATRVYSLEGVPLGDRLTIEILSDTRRITRKRLIEGSLYRTQETERDLGIAVRRVRLLPALPRARAHGRDAAAAE